MIICLCTWQAEDELVYMKWVLYSRRNYRIWMWRAVGDAVPDLAGLEIELPFSAIVQTYQHNSKKIKQNFVDLYSAYYRFWMHFSSFSSDQGFIHKLVQLSLFLPNSKSKTNWIGIWAVNSILKKWIEFWIYPELDRNCLNLASIRLKLLKSGLKSQN